MTNAVKDAGKEAQEKLGWGYAHRFLLWRRFTQLAILFMFLSGPLFGLWILRGNYSGSKFLNTIPATDPLIFIQSLAAGYWPTVSTVLLGAIIIIVAYAILAGKLFCSWVCPFNMVTDFAAWLRRKLNIQSGLKISNKLRYAVLAGVIVGSAVTGVIVWEWLNPITIMGRGIITVAGELPDVFAVTSDLHESVSEVAGEYGTTVTTVAHGLPEDAGVIVSFWRLLVFGFGAGAWMLLAIFIFDLFVVRNGWCGHICPVGALYGLIGTKGILHLDATRREDCTNCMDCINICPEPQVLPKPLFAKQESTLISSNECLRCGRCIDVCPEKVFSITTNIFKTSKGEK